MLTGIKTRKSSGTKVSKFISRLYEMINNTKNIETLTWTDSGSAFAIVNTDSFTINLLKKHFKNKNYSSFVRQLNLYGFRKKRDTGEIHVYAHEYFLQASPEVLCEIHRRVSECSKQAVSMLDSEKNAIIEIKVRQQILETKFEKLEQKNKKLMAFNQAVVLRVKRYRDHEEKVEQLLITMIQGIKDNQTNAERNCLNILMQFLTNSSQQEF